MFAYLPIIGNTSTVILIIRDNWNRVVSGHASEAVKRFLK